MSIPYVGPQELEEQTPWLPLMEAIAQAFRDQGVAPERHHHHIPQKDAAEITLLLMPAWSCDNGEFGVKLATVAPRNASIGLPTIHGLYVLFSADTGIPQAMFDAGALTTRRTAAASALASVRLSRTDSRSMLMVGSGRLARQLVAAHCATRPIRRVRIWSRTEANAERLAGELRDTICPDCFAINDIQSFVSHADIISCATYATVPAIQGRWLRRGTHVDLVGAYRPDMCEADPDTFCLADKVYVDTMQGARREAGDLIQAVNKDKFSFDRVAGDLYSIAEASSDLRDNDSQITVFKSVGSALEDLAAARLCLDRIRRRTAGIPAP